MLLLSFLQHYLIWHYTRAIEEMGHLSRNFVWFTWHYFGTVHLWRSLFLPYRRITENRGRRFSFEDLAGFLLINFISRLIGFFLRFTMIIAGYASLLILLLLILSTYLVWLIAPIFILVSLGIGISLLIPA